MSVWDRKKREGYGNSEVPRDLSPDKMQQAIEGEVRKIWPYIVLSVAFGLMAMWLAWMSVDDLRGITVQWYKVQIKGGLCVAFLLASVAVAWFGRYTLKVK